MRAKALLVSSSVLLALTACGGGSADATEVIAWTNVADLGAAVPLRGESVRLVKAYSAAAVRAGGGGFVRSFLVRTDSSLGRKKAVFIHHSAGPKEPWTDYPGELVGTAASQDYWLVRLGSGNGAQFEGGTEFVAKYVADDRIYWDNNSWRNYTLGHQDGPFLASDVPVLLESAVASLTEDGYTMSINVDVRDVAYSKRVRVLYSTDGWATAKEGSASYRYGYHMGYGNLIATPNRFGVEPWAVTVTEKGLPQTIEFAIAYTADRDTYWDNNAGQNYLIAFESGKDRLVNAKWIP
jgi:hypothetical protein